MQKKPTERDNRWGKLSKKKNLSVVFECTDITQFSHCCTFQPTLIQTRTLKEQNGKAFITQIAHYKCVRNYNHWADDVLNFREKLGRTGKYLF